MVEAYLLNQNDMGSGGGVAREVAEITGVELVQMSSDRGRSSRLRGGEGP